MTGEMYSINRRGEDSNGEVWSVHAAVAGAVRGKLQPFDAYQGPYIVIGPDVRVGNPPYALAVQHLGGKRLWLTSDEGFWGRGYREDTDTLSEPFPMFDTRAACRQARKLLAS